MKFIVSNAGDSDVGLQGFEITVTVDDSSDEIIKYSEDPKGFEDRMKAFLMSEFGEYDGQTRVYTQEEIDAEVDYEDSLNEGF
jgi:hypothetical protein